MSSELAQAKAAMSSELAQARAAIATNLAETKAAIAEAKSSIIMWVVAAIFLAQLLPALLKLFGVSASSRRR
jgi:hypothetical protein